MNIFSIRELDKSDNIEFTTHETSVTESPATIMVVGTGSGGSNAIDHMYDSGLAGVRFIAINTDKQHLDVISKAETKLLIGNGTTKEKGAGGDPLKGEKAANEDHDLIRKTLKGADMVFVTTGLGGGTGTGSTPVIANIAKEAGALTVAVVTLPFKFEGPEKMRIAEEGIKKLKEEVDTLIIIPNDNLYKMIDRKISFKVMLRYANEILLQAVRGISDLITQPGHINCDFADVEATMRGQGNAHLGIGIGSGEARAKDAADKAIYNPLLEDISISGASRLLVNIAGSEELLAYEVEEILGIIKEKAGPDARLKFGVTYDSDLGENIKVTVIATDLKKNEAECLKAGAGLNKEEAMVDFVNIKQFEEMKLQTDRRPSENYGNFYNQNDYKNLQDVPAMTRRGNYSADLGYNDRISANG